MSEIEPASDPPTQTASIEIHETHDAASKSVSDDVQTAVDANTNTNSAQRDLSDANLTATPPSSTQIGLPTTTTTTTTSAAGTAATSATPATQVKRFSSASINKKFLQKTSLAAQAATAATPAPSGASTNPAPVKGTASPGSKPNSSTLATSRFVTTKLTQNASSTPAKWSKESPSGTPKSVSTASTPNADPVGNGKSGLVLQSTKLSGSTKPMSSSTANSGGPVWGSVTSSVKANSRVQDEFPTAAELKDKADKAAANSAAQRRSLDAFRGIHLDPNAQHWDEMEEEEDFLSGPVEFGDGKQYTVVPPSAEPETGEPAQSSDVPATEDRLGNDFDRSWPGSTQRSHSPSKTNAGPPQERLLFNERHNRMEAPPTRQPPTGHALLTAHSGPPTGRGEPSRRGSDSRNFRDPSSPWNLPFQRGPSNGHFEDRGRRVSTSEREKDAQLNQGALGPHLRDRSPDGSGRFPGRRIGQMNRRDSQASSAIVGSGPARSTRALSRESSDRGSGVRQLPPHLAAPKGPNAPPLITSPSSISAAPRNSWRDSPTSARSPRNQFQNARPSSVVESEGSFAQKGPEVTTTEKANALSDTASQPASSIVPAIIEDEGTLKAAMAVSAERARKRREEEEQERERQKERARQKLLELEARLQADKEEKEKKKREEEEEERKRKEREEEEERKRKQKEQEEAERRKQEEAAKAEKQKPTQQGRERPDPRPANRSLTAADTALSWRRTGPIAPAPAPIENPAPTEQTKGVNGNFDPKRSPTILQNPRNTEEHPVQKSVPPELQGKPANAGKMAEVLALQLNTKDEVVEVLDFSDLRQLAEGYNGSLSVSTIPVNGPESSPAAPLVNLKPQVESRPVRNSDQTRPPRSPVDETRGSRLGKPTRSQPPAPLSLGPRSSQDHGQPLSGGLGSGRSPRAFDPNHVPYKEAPISVLDDTMSRFKKAIMHSNPVHAGMSSDDIMQGLGRADGDGLARKSLSQTSPVMFSSADKPDTVSGSLIWARTQGELSEEEMDVNVLIPTLSLNREPIPYRKIQGMKASVPWRWENLSFEPPVPFMSRRTLSVMDTLSETTNSELNQLKIKVPGRPLRVVPYSYPKVRVQPPVARPRREDLPNGVPLLQAPKTAPLNTQWPPKAKGADDAVWRRGVALHSSSAKQEESNSQSSATVQPQTAPITKHNHGFSIQASPSPIGTPLSNTWGRSPLSIPVIEDLPEDTSLKAAWDKASSTEVATTKNSLIDIADEPPPKIPTSMSEVRSDDGDTTKRAEKLPTPPPVRVKYDPHRAFQQVSAVPQVPRQTPSPMAAPMALPSAHPTPQTTNALALTTNQTPGHTPPIALPTSNLPNPNQRQYSVTYSSPLLTNATPFNQVMMQQQALPPPQPQPPQFAPTTPMMAPITPGMLHRSISGGVPMQSPMPPSNPVAPLWGQPTGGPVTPGPGGYGRPMHPPHPMPMQYQPNVPHNVPQPGAQTSLSVYMPGSMMHPPSPGPPSMGPPGMGKPFSPNQRPLHMNNTMPPMQPPPLQHMPTSFQGPPNPQIHYLPHNPLPPSSALLQQQGPPGQVPLHLPQMQGMPQSRGMPMHPPQYQQPQPNVFQRPW
ncbi:hypothetical protein FRC19_006138 [Serendipita sp. 401]|nr:hypothetical protein FRC19_006138 [Serendipita sp. 401]